MLIDCCEFNFVEVLEMKFDFRIDANHLSETIEVDRSFNANLTELIIAEQFICEESILTQLIAMYPNLEKFCISTTGEPPTTSQFQLILNGFKKIKSLDLDFGYWNISDEYLDCIKDRKNNFKSMNLSSLKDFSAEHKEKLSAVFDVISFEHGNLYITSK